MTARSRKSPYSRIVHKPQGQIHQRVQLVGPERFGIVSVDCAKLRSKMLLCDFFGKVLIPPTVVAHNQADLQAAIRLVEQARQQHQLQDLLVAVERTGIYHRAVQEAFRAAGCETRLVHPFATVQFRRPADPGNKTDDTDLAAIFRATVNGFGLVDAVWPEDYLHLQVLARHRRDLVRKQAKLRCQIRSTLHSLMPGLAECFSDIFDFPAILAIAARTGSAQAVSALGLNGLRQLVTELALRCRNDTLVKVLAWTGNAVAPLPPLETRREVLASLEEDRLAKNQQILALERQLAHVLVRTPYALLLVIPGINVTSAAELAGELGPMTCYANANRITGRAGLHPSRYQSDSVDARGPLRRGSNRRLRCAIMQIADNLVACNHHFRVQALTLKQRGKNPYWIRVKVAKTFSRLAFAMVMSGNILRHPCCQQRHYLLDKIVEFHQTHDTPMPRVLQDLEAATRQLPRSSHAHEAAPLHERLRQLQQRKRGPRPLQEIIPIVLARLGIHLVPSTAEEQDPS